MGGLDYSWYLCCKKFRENVCRHHLFILQHRQYFGVTLVKILIKVILFLLAKNKGQEDCKIFIYRNRSVIFSTFNKKTVKSLSTEISCKRKESLAEQVKIQFKTFAYNNNSNKVEIQNRQRSSDLITGN